MNRGHLRRRLLRQLFGQLRLGNVHVGQVGHLRDVFGRQCQAVELGLQQQGPEVLQAALHVGQLFPMQAVANFQVVVQKAQRRTDREGVQPQGRFGQLDRHGVFVHAEDGFLQNHAAHDVPVVQLRVGHGPAVVFRSGFDALANGGHALKHRALPRPAQLGKMRCPRLLTHPVGARGDGFKHAVGQIVHQRHQKVPAAHGGVTNFEFQNLAGRVERVECVPVAGVE